MTTQKGFTLIHVLLSISLLSFSGLQIMGLSKNATQTTSYMNNRVNLLDVRNILQGILKDPNACRETFQNKQLFPDRTRQYQNSGSVAIKDDTGGILYQLNDRIAGLEFLGLSLAGYNNGTILEEIDSDGDGINDQEVLLHLVHLKFKKPQSLEIGQNENSIKLVLESTIESVSGALSGNKKIIACNLVGEEDLNPIWGEQLGDIYNRRGRRLFWGGVPNDTTDSNPEFLFYHHKVNIISDTKEMETSSGEMLYPIPLGVQFRSGDDCRPALGCLNHLYNRTAIIADFTRYYDDPVQPAVDGFGADVNFNLKTRQGMEATPKKFSRGTISYRRAGDESTGKFVFRTSTNHVSDAYAQETILQLSDREMRVHREAVFQGDIKINGRLIHQNQRAIVEKVENLSDGTHTNAVCADQRVLRGCYYEADYPTSQTLTVNAATNTVTVLTPKANAYPFVNAGGNNVCRCEFENIQAGTGACISYCF